MISLPDDLPDDPDSVLGFEKHEDARSFRQALEARLAQFNLTLHPEETRLLRFGWFAIEDRKKRGEGKPETFDFLGFTHICDKTKNGMFNTAPLINGLTGP